MDRSGTGGLSFRSAEAGEMPRILRMQTEIFCGEQDIPEDLIAAFLSCGPTCWVAERGGEIVASIAAWEEGGKVHLGRFVVLPQLRGRKIGTELLRHAVRELFGGGTETIYMESRDSTARMVRTIGGRDTGEPFAFYRGNVTPQVLEKSAWMKARETEGGAS